VKLKLVSKGLDFPTSVATDVAGCLYVAEAGLPFGGASPGGRVWKVSRSGDRALLGEAFRPPVNGLTFHDGALYVSEGGHPGRITQLFLDGRRQVVLDHLPGPGNYHTNMTAFGPDGKLYFSQGAMTNSGVVGLDAYELGWLGKLPHACDAPGFDLVLTGLNFETEDPLSDTQGARTQTGAFVPFGTRTRPGQTVVAQLPCTASVMRCNSDGSQLELVAWGLRNAYGLRFTADGKLLAIDQGADDRGSRPIGNAPDALFEVRSGAWCGWPDYVAGEPVTSEAYRPDRGGAPAFLIANHSQLPPPARPLFKFQPHAAATKFDFVGQDLYAALFGDEKPLTAPDGPRCGRSVVRIDAKSWTMRDSVDGPFHRPIDVSFSTLEGALYVLDFGRFEVHPGGGLKAEAGTGSLWRLT